MTAKTPCPPGQHDFFVADKTHDWFLGFRWVFVVCRKCGYSFTERTK